MATGRRVGTGRALRAHMSKLLIVAATVFALASPAFAQDPLPPVEVVHLVHLDARSTTDIVARLLGPEGICTPHAETNSIILIDDAPHVARIRQLVERLERRAAERRTVETRGGRKRSRVP